MALLAVVLAAGGCGAAAHGPRPTGSLTAIPIQTAAQLTRTAPAAIRDDPLPAVGVSQQVRTRGAALTVTLRQVIDPLTGSGAVLQNGIRAVGVIVQIRNAGPQIYDSSATGDFSVLVSSGYVTPVLATQGVCKTPQQDFDRYITAGEDRVGCVVFAIPDRAALDAVTFSPHAQAKGHLRWAP